MDEESAMNAPPTAGPSTAAAPMGDDGVPLSKNAQKKAAKRARHQALKGERRALEKARRRDRAHYLAEGYAAGTLSAEDAALVERQRAAKRARKVAARGEEGDVFPGGVVIDLGFDELMTDGEITSMASQVAFVYSANRTAKRPFAAVLHTSFAPELSPRLWAKMGRSQWARWTRSHFWREDVGVVNGLLGKDGMDVDGDKGEAAEKGQTQDVPGPSAKATDSAGPEAPLEPVPTTAAAPADTNNSGPTAVEPDLAALAAHLTGPHLPPTIPPTHKLVYLSADADEELTTLADDEVYVIGGIVDRNRHKNKADGLGIRTARLPIGSFIENLPTRKVLTVNQVFEILTRYLELGDWRAAFEAVIPQRKYFHGREEARKAKRAGEGGDGGEGEGEGADEEGGEEEARKDAGGGAASLTDEEEAMNA